MKVNKQVSALLLASGLVVGGLGAGVLMTPSPSVTQAAPISQDKPASVDDNQVQDPSYVGSIPVDSTTTDQLSEADEAAALQGQATITAGDAEVAALAANPDATVLKIELDNENGYLVYSVELDNGMDVKIDAGNGAVLATDQDQDEEDEQNEQPDDATEVPSVEDASGQ